MATHLPPLPASLKPIQHYLKTANEHDKRDSAVAYYCRLYALQRGMELDKSSPDSRAYLMSLMDIVEKEKAANRENEAVSSEVVGHAHVENYALKLFLYADNEDRAGKFGKNVVKSFYTAGMLFDVLTQFGELSDDVENNRKYAKWKAAYIHNCLKNGETPHAGPLDDDNTSDTVKSAPEIGFHQNYSDAGEFQQPSGYISPPASAYEPAVQPTPAVRPAPAVQPTPAARPAVPASSLQSDTQAWKPPPNPAGVTLSSTEYQRAQKLCKYATSALTYEDSQTAIDNLIKALNLLTTGRE